MEPAGPLPPLVALAAGLAAALLRPGAPGPPSLAAAAALLLLLVGGDGAAGGLVLDGRGRPFAALAAAGLLLALRLRDEAGDAGGPRRGALLVAGLGPVGLALAGTVAAAAAGLALLAGGVALLVREEGPVRRGLLLPGLVAGALAAIGLAVLAPAAGGGLDALAWPGRPGDGAAGPWLAGAAPLVLGLAPALLGAATLAGRGSAAGAALLATAGPAGAAGLLARVLGGLRLPSGAPLADPGAAPALLAAGGLAAAALGLVVALRADGVRRVAAGCAAAQGGLLLLGLAALAVPAPIDPAGPRRALLLLLTAGLLAQGGLGALALTGARELGGDGLDRWVGAGRRNPWLGAALVALLAGPAALPPSLGFVAGVTLAAALVQAGLAFAALAAAATAPLLLLVALRLGRLLFHVAPPDSPWGPPAVEPLASSPGLTTLAVLLAALGLLLGLSPPALLL